MYTAITSLCLSLSLAFFGCGSVEQPAQVTENQQVVSTAQTSTGTVGEAQDASRQTPESVQAAQPDESDSGTETKKGERKVVKYDETKEEERKKFGELDFSQRLGSISEEHADDKENPIVTKEKAKSIFGVTIEGSHYNLPCPVVDFLYSGWDIREGYLGTADGKYTMEPEEEVELPLAYSKNDAYVINVKVVNNLDRSCDWEAATITSVEVEPATSKVTMTSDAGFGTSSTLDELFDVVGCSADAKLQEDSWSVVEVPITLYDKPLYDWRCVTLGNVDYAWDFYYDTLVSLKISTSNQSEEDVQADKVVEGFVQLGR